MALSLQLGNVKPIYFGASVTTGDGTISFDLTPLASPFADTDVTPFDPVAPTFSAGPFPLSDDGSFTADLPAIAVPPAANSITSREMAITVTLDGKACPGEGNGAFCGTVTGEVTEPISLALKPGKNSFAFNAQGASLAYECGGGTQTTTSTGASSSTASSSSGGPSCDAASCSGCDTTCDDFGTCYTCCYSCSGSTCEQNCDF